MKYKQDCLTINYSIKQCSTDFCSLRFVFYCQISQGQFHRMLVFHLLFHYQDDRGAAWLRWTVYGSFA